LLARVGRRAGRLSRVLSVIHWRSLARLARLRLNTTSRRIAAAMIALAGLTALIVALGLWLTGRAPSWWRPLSTGDPALLATADAVENGVTTLINELRPGDSPAARGAPWSMTLDDDSASAWLATKLPRWVLSRADLARWPPEVRLVQARFSPGRIIFAARVVQGRHDDILSIALAPRIDADGSLWLEATSVSIGSLPLPAGLALRSGDASEAPGILDARNAVPDELRSRREATPILAALRGERPLAALAPLRLPDGRRIRVVNLEPQEGRLVITCITTDADR
jgi:hypothetical protein